MRARPSTGPGSRSRVAQAAPPGLTGFPSWVTHFAPPRATGSLFILALMAVLAVVAGFAALIAALFPALAA